ncbi:MAG: hypothetical protein IKC77_08635 [Lentisphaeria bacterium]|nr:hypothetical protein [Lentisphaeria bacterium]
MAVPQSNIDKKRMAKNTMYLYIRMILLLCVNFFTVRLALNILGIVNYGIFDLIFGFVVMFMTLNNSLVGMIHRFLCYEMGKGNQRNVRLVFNISLLFFLSAALMYVVLAETVGLWFVRNKLNIPETRMTAALVAYQFAVFSVVLKTVQIPYNAIITAFERMDIFAKVTIIEVTGQLVSVLLLKVVTFDLLIAYSCFFPFSDMLVVSIYMIYCYTHFKECKPIMSFSKARILHMGSFFSWGSLSALARVFGDQGLNILLNVFCGVTFNATFGLANKLGIAVCQIAGKFQVALNPQIVKSYGAKDDKGFFDLVISASRYSFLLIWLFALPLLIQTEFLLKLWLGEKLPVDIIIFVRYTVLSSIVNTVNCPLWTAAFANGKVKGYHIGLSILIFLMFVLSYCALLMGATAKWVPGIIFGVNMLTWGYRVRYLKKVYGFPLKQYMKNAVKSIVLIMFISTSISIVLKNVFPTSFVFNILLGLTCLFVNLVFIFRLGLNYSERSYCIQKIKGVIGYGC